MNRPSRSVDSIGSIGSIDSIGSIGPTLVDRLDVQNKAGSNYTEGRDASSWWWAREVLDR